MQAGTVNVSAQKRKVSTVTEEKEDRFWQMLEENPGHLKVVDPDNEAPAVLWTSSATLKEY